MKKIGSYINNYIKSGDKKWFALIYREIMPRIYRFYYLKTLNSALSEDLVSEVFIRVYKNLKKTKLNEKSFMVWIYRIASNLLIDHYRKNSHNTQSFDLKQDYIQVTDEEIFKKNSSQLKKEFSFKNTKLISSMNKLTGLQRDVLLLRFVEDMDYHTIANIFSRSEGTIRGIIFRAIEKLGKEIKKDNG